MPTKGRVDRRHCKAACRTLAYRVRLRVKAVRPPGPLEPVWAEPNAVVKTMLTSLAQIQARVLDFAHQLEHEELYARRPVKNEQEESAASQAGKEDEEAADAAGATSQADEPGDEDTVVDEETEDSQPQEDHQTAINGLRQELMRAQENAAKESARATAAENRATALELALNKLRVEWFQPRDRPSESTGAIDRASAAARLDEVAKQRDQLQADLFTEREYRASLEIQLTSQRKELSDVIGRANAIHDKQRREISDLTAQATDLTSRLKRAVELLTGLKKVEAEAQSLLTRSNALEHQNAELRAEVERLRGPSADADPLLLLMIDRVKALDSLAAVQTRRGVKVTGIFLRSNDKKDVLAAAQAWAFKVRRDYYLHGLVMSLIKPTWVIEDRLLDPESEQQAVDEAKIANEQLLHRLEREKNNARWGV